MSEQIVLLYATATKHVIAALTRTANADAEVSIEELAPGGLLYRIYNNISRTFEIGAEHLSAGVAEVASIGGIIGDPQSFVVSVSDDDEITPKDLPDVPDVEIQRIRNARNGVVTIKSLQKAAGDGDEITFWGLIEGGGFSETAETTVAFDEAGASPVAELRFARRPPSGRRYRLLVLATNRQPLVKNV